LFSNPFDLAVEAAGTIVVADPHAQGTGGVIRVDPSTGKQKMLSSGKETGSAAQLREIGIALEADGSIIIVEQSLAGGGMGNGRITRINPKSGKRSVVSEGGVFSSPAGVAIEATGGIVVADTAAFGGSGGVIRIDPTNGQQTQVAAGGSFVTPIAIVVDAKGQILVADTDAFAGKGGVIRVNPQTGAQKTVSQGGTFGGPRGITIVAAH
jgi:sugar lactone lactonase YvrE